jgi:protein SCO1/2
VKKNSSIWLFVLLVLAVPVTAYALFTLYENNVGTLPVLGKTKDHSIADFKLTDQDGDIKTTADWNNKIVIVDFFFSHCPSVCPKMTNSLKTVQEAYKDDPTILLHSISIDPERDSATQLRKYADQYEINTKNWSLLTGNKKDIYKMARNSFMIVATDGDGGPDDFIHSEKLVLIDTKKRIRGYYDGTSSKEVNQLIRDIKKLKNEN